MNHSEKRIFQAGVAEGTKKAARLLLKIRLLATESKESKGSALKTIVATIDSVNQ